MASDKTTVQTAQDRPETVVHNQVDAFAQGHGPILSRADQTLALQSHRGRESTAHLPSNEGLLEQLRRDTKKFEADAPKSLAGLESPYRYSERSRQVESIEAHESGILQTRDQVQKYTPEQLKDIGDLVDAVHDPAKLKGVMSRFTDAEKFTELAQGVMLEEERRGMKTDIGLGYYTNKQDQTVASLSVSNPRTGSVRNFDGPAHTLTQAERAAQPKFEWNNE
jgi:hypothetical protein